MRRAFAWPVAALMLAPGGWIAAAAQAPATAPTPVTAPAPAPPVSAPTPEPAEKAAPYVAIRTDAGTIVLALDAARALVTTANFLRYVDARRLDGATFYRAMHLDWGQQPNGLIQGGIGNDPKRAFKPIAHEPTDRTGILHKAGTVSMARWTPGTAAGDFSIMLSDMPGLDANPQAATDDARAGFAAFGHVVEGMAVVRAIWDAPRSDTRGEGVMKGQLLAAPVRIISARRIAAPATSAPATPAPAAPSRMPPAPAPATPGTPAPAAP